MKADDGIRALLLGSDAWFDARGRLSVGTGFMQQVGIPAFSLWGLGGSGGPQGPRQGS